MRSQRHLREYNPPDSAGQVQADMDESYADAAQYTLTVNNSAVSITHPNTSVVTATLLLGGAPVVGQALAAVSSATGKATVAGDGNTNASGQVAFTITSVAAGTATVTINAAGQRRKALVAVTVT